MRLVYRESNGLAWVAQSAPRHLLLRARKLHKATRAGRVIPHVSEKEKQEVYDYTYKQKNKRISQSNKAPYDFTI